MQTQKEVEKEAALLVIRKAWAAADASGVQLRQGTAILEEARALIEESNIESAFAKVVAKVEEHQQQLHLVVRLVRHHDGQTSKNSAVALGQGGQLRSLGGIVCAVWDPTAATLVPSNKTHANAVQAVLHVVLTELLATDGRS